MYIREFDVGVILLLHVMKMDFKNSHCRFLDADLVVGHNSLGVE